MFRGRVAATPRLGRGNSVGRRYGGHSSKLLEALPSGARLLAFDRDGDELSKTTARLADSRFESVHANYANVGGELRKRSLRASSLLADLGCSSMQIDDPTRGFTFKRDGPLDMRMDVSNSETAADWLRRASTSDVAAALRSAADFSRRDARELAVAVRREPRPTTTTEFADRVRAVQLEEATVGDDAVKRAMQAARVAVNDEFAALDELLASLPDVLAPGGRAVFLTSRSEPKSHAAVPLTVPERVAAAASLDSPPRNIRVASAAVPRLASTEYPRGIRGGAATRLHGISTWHPRRCRDSPPRNIRVETCGVGSRAGFTPAKIAA